MDPLERIRAEDIHLSQEHDVSNHFRQVLLDAKNTVLGTPSDNCSLALEESGLICFVPGDTQVGD
jgi:hypothetical protein